MNNSRPLPAGSQCPAARPTADSPKQEWRVQLDPDAIQRALADGVSPTGILFLIAMERRCRDNSSWSAKNDILKKECGLSSTWFLQLVMHQLEGFGGGNGDCTGEKTNGRCRNKSKCGGYDPSKAWIKRLPGSSTKSRRIAMLKRLDSRRPV